jgi:hypothetical protein
MVVANKTWEAAPLLNVLFERKARPSVLSPTARIYDPDVAPMGDRTHPTAPALMATEHGAAVQV